MKKLHFSLGYSSVALLMLPTIACSEKSKEKKPMNILYIMTDDYSYQTISGYDKRYISISHPIRNEVNIR